MRVIPSRHALAAAVGVGALSSAATAGMTYTPLAFGPLTDPGGGRYYTNVYDISADGRSYVGILNDNDLRYVHDGASYNMSGPGGPFGISPDGRTAVGGLANQPAQRWDVDNAAGNNIASTPIQASLDYFVNAPAYGVNSAGNAFSISSPTGVLTDSGFIDPDNAFQAIDIGAFAGANRGLAVDAPIAYTLGFVPGNDTNAYRWNYETGDLTALELPGNENSLSLGGVGEQISGDGMIVGGAASATNSIGEPYYWDASGSANKVPTIGDRIWGSVNAVNYTGTLMGGTIFGAGLDNHAFLFDPASETTWDLNDLFSDVIPDGWVLFTTTHISDDGSRIFARAIAPDGSQRAVELEGDFIPTPGTAALMGMGGLAAVRRRR